MTFRMRLGDSRGFEVAVALRGSKDPLVLTGCTVEALAWSRSGKIVHASASIANAQTGLIHVDFGIGALTLGDWTLLVRVTKGAERHVVREFRLFVDPSPF